MCVGGGGEGPCHEWEPGPCSRRGVLREETLQGGLGQPPECGLRSFQSPPTSFPSSLCVACSLSHSFSSAKFIFSLLLPRSQDCRCTHVAWLPGQGGWGGWAGKGGFNLGGRVEVSRPPPQPQTDVLGALASLLHLRARLGLRWEEHGVCCQSGARCFWEGLVYLELVVWSVGFRVASGPLR